MREGRIRALLGAVSVVGIALSLYLTWTYAIGSSPACLGGSGGCETVQSSPYSRLLGIPVAALGLGGYAALLLSAALRGVVGIVSGLFLALLGALYSGYLTWLEVFVIEALCQWCLASAALMVAALILTTLRLRFV
ncbi:hypothetical protein BH20ACT11_BH20ACT11_05580 [soil metagenome]